jgi:hypothetical protein
MFMLMLMFMFMFMFMFMLLMLMLMLMFMFMLSHVTPYVKHPLEIPPFCFNSFFLCFTFL